MSRIRTIKPELFSSTSTKHLSLGARWLFAGLFTEADDEGRMLASVRKIAGNVFPADDDISETQVADWLDELEGAGRMVVRYQVEGIRYLCIPSFHKHQRVSHPTPSRIPPPPEPLTKTSGVAPEFLRPDLGIGIDLGKGSGIELKAPPEELRERKHTPPDAKPQIRDGPAWFPRTPRAKTIVGLNEEQHRPKTVDELLAHPNAKTFKKRLPKLSASPSALRDAVAARFQSFTTKHLEHGAEAAWSGLREWLEDPEAKHARKARFSDGTEPSSAPPEDPRRAKLLAHWRARAGPEDLPPFHVWAERAEADGTAARILGERDESIPLKLLTKKARGET